MLNCTTVIYTQQFDYGLLTRMTIEVPPGLADALAAASSSTQELYLLKMRNSPSPPLAVSGPRPDGSPSLTRNNSVRIFAMPCSSSRTWPSLSSP